MSTVCLLANRLLFLCPGQFGKQSTGPSKDLQASRASFFAKDLRSLSLVRNAMRARCQQIAAAAPGTINLCGKTTPADLAGLIQRAEVAVTNDSGSMHVAASLNKPMVSVFGPTNPVHIGPYERPESVVRVDLPCSPCNYRRLSQCPFDHACMKQVTSEMVVERARKILAAAKL